MNTCPVCNQIKDTTVGGMGCCPECAQRAQPIKGVAEAQAIMEKAGDDIGNAIAAGFRANERPKP